MPLEIVGVVEYGEVQQDTGYRRSFWTKIGRAYENKDGSMTLSFDYFPRDAAAKIMVREAREAPARGGGGGHKSQRRAPAAAAPERGDLQDDDIPFNTP